MKHILLLGTMAAIGLILASSLLGVDVGFSLLTSDSLAANISRVIMLGTLSIIALTSRPRSKVLRVVFAAVSVGVTTYAVYQAGNYSLAFVDAAVYVLGGIILMCEALEDAQFKAPVSVPRTRRELA